MVVRNSPTLHFYKTRALLKQECGWKEWGLILLCGSKTIGTNRMLRNAFWLDRSDKLQSCILQSSLQMHTWYNYYNNTHKRMCVHAIACIWIHVVPVGESGTTLYICTNNIIHARTYCLPSWAINKHLWTLNSRTRHEQWKLNIYMFRSWHSTYLKDTIDALYMPAFGCIPYSH